MPDNNALVQDMLNCLPGLIYRASCLSNGQSRFDFVSESVHEVAGLTYAELEENGRMMFERIHPEDRAELISSLMRHGDQLCTWRHTYRINHPHKGLRWQKVVAIPSKRRDGAVEWFGYIEDISDQRRTNAMLDNRNRLLQALNTAQSHWIERQDIRAACTVLMKALLQATEAQLACAFECDKESAGQSRLRVLAFENTNTTRPSFNWTQKLSQVVAECIRQMNLNGDEDQKSSPQPIAVLSGDHGDIFVFPLVAHGEIMGALCLTCEPDHAESIHDDTLESVLSSLSQLLLASRLHLRLHTQSKELSATRFRLNNSNELTRAAMEYMNHGMCIIDKDGYVVAHNQHYLDLLNLPRDLLATTPQHKLVVEFQMRRGDFGPSYDLVSEEARDYVRANSGWMFSPEKYLRRTRDGRTLEIRSRQLREGGMVRTYTDVTAFQDSLDKLRIERHRLQCALHGSRAGVWEMDVSRGTISFDHHCCRMLAVAELDTKHWDLTKLTHMVHPQDRASLLRQGMRCLVRSQKFFDVDCRIRKNDGQWCWVHVRGAVVDDAMVSDGAISKMIGTCTDISDRMRLVQEVQFLNESLRQQVLEKTHSLQCSLENLETLSFALAHDLKAPIRSIDGLAMMLTENKIEGAPEIAPLKKIQSLTRSMGSMITDMLELIRHSQQTLHLERVDTEQLVRSVVETVVPPEISATVSIDELPQVYADKTMLTHVFINLIDNAVKYTCLEAAPKIAIGFDHQEDAFFIRDNGMGFDMKAADTLFRPFGRLHSKEGIEGSGIGLATCAQMILRHGGKIWAASKPDEGATFWVRIPRQIAPEISFDMCEDGKDYPPHFQDELSSSGFATIH